MGIIEKSEFAALAGVSRPAISKAIREGRVILDPSGKRVDLDEPINQKYLQGNRNKTPPAKPKTTKRAATTKKTAAKKSTTAKRAATTKKAPKTKPTPPPKRPPQQTGRQGPKPKDETQDPQADAYDPYYHTVRETNVEASDLKRMTLDEIFRRFGTMRSVIDHCDALKKIEDIEMRQTKNAKERGDLIPRAVVKTMLGHFDEAHARMLSDVPAALATLIHPLCGGSIEKEKLEEMIRDTNSKDINAAKAKVRRKVASMKRAADART